MTTTVPAVRLALQERIKGLVSPEIPVIYGQPGPRIPGRFISVSSTVDGLVREQRTLPLRASGSRTETYDLRLVIWWLDGGHDSNAQQRATENAWALFDQIDASLRAETTLGGVVTSALLVRVQDDDFALDEGRAAQLVCSLSVTVNRA